MQIGRATRGLVENISISTSYGSMPIGQLANITVPDTQTIKIESRDKSVLPAIEKAIYDL
ncbi:ribosome recycling factor [bacterium]|nr:ribosome recycling factor [bacterium]